MSQYLFETLKENIKINPTLRNKLQKDDNNLVYQWRVENKKKWKANLTILYFG